MNEISYQEQYSKIYSKILDFIAHKPRSKGEVIQKLNSYETVDSIKKDIIEDLVSSKYINDEEYVKTYINGVVKSRKAISLRKIKEKLGKHKIDIDKYSYLFDFPKDFEKANCLKAAKSKLRNLRSEKNMFVKKQKLKRYLYYKGYPISVINSVVDFLL